MNPKYIETAKRCKERLGKYKMFMTAFVDKSTVCGTTFCMAGDLARQDGYPGGDINNIEDYDYFAYSAGLIGVTDSSPEWAWLFDGEWPNDLELAKERCNYAIQHGKAPPPSNVLWKLIGGYV